MAKEVSTANATKEQIALGLALLNKKVVRDEKISKGLIKGDSYKPMSELSPEEQTARRAKEKVYTQRATARLAILKEKAAAAGISVTEAEIDARLKQA